MHYFDNIYAKRKIIVFLLAWNLVANETFQFICRAAQFLKVMSDTQSLQESQNLSMFLATQNKVRDTLKEKLQAIPAHEDLLC